MEQKSLNSGPCIDYFKTKSRNAKCVWKRYKKEGTNQESGINVRPCQNRIPKLFFLLDKMS